MGSEKLPKLVVQTVFELLALPYFICSPLNFTVPEVGFCNPIITLARVDLPQILIAPPSLKFLLLEYLN